MPESTRRWRGAQVLANTLRLRGRVAGVVRTTPAAAGRTFGAYAAQALLPEAQRPAMMIRMEQTNDREREPVLRGNPG